jgi:LPS-assembly protein
MKRCALLLIFLLSIALPGSFAADAEPELIIRNGTPETEAFYNETTGIWGATNGVVATYGQVTLTAKSASGNMMTGDVLAEGDVQLQQSGQIWRGPRLEYNFKTRQMRSETFRTGMAPFYVSGEGLSADISKGFYSATNSIVTTDDVAEPAFKIRARSLTMVPGKYIEARDATVYLGSVPVFFYPYYHRSLVRHPNNFAFLPGYRSLYGPYLLGEYNWFLNDQLSGSLHLDYRLKRGVGFGPDAAYDLGRWGKGNLMAYYAHDEDPGEDTAGRPIRTDRHRLHFSHHATIQTNLSAKIVVREQSDALMIRDFFEGEYRQDTQPKSFFEVSQHWPNWSLDLLAQPQLNDFFQTVERLPDVKLSALRQQLGITPFYYEGENSVGYFRFQPAEGLSPEYAAFRADSFHQLLLPQTYFGWLNFTPRVGGRFTHYGETDGQANFEAQDRTVFNTGAEVSFKASRIWREARSRVWDVTELRHIIEPSVNYVFVPSPSKAPLELPQFDTEIPSLRLIPIDFPDYNAVDSIDSQNVLRLGLRNKLQTKRRGEIDHLVNWAVYTDWRLDPRADQSTFADLFSDLDLKPRSWLTLNSETRYDIDAGNFRMANHWATLLPNNTWAVSVGHRYFRRDPRFESRDPRFAGTSENNLVFSSIYFRLNENWAARMTHHFEGRDGVMEEQYYTIYRDLRSWTAALTLRLRDNRIGQDDFTIAITFSLKAFPRFRLGEDQLQPASLLGG